MGKVSEKISHLRNSRIPTGKKLSLNNQLDPQIFLVLGAHNRYANYYVDPYCCDVKNKARKPDNK